MKTELSFDNILTLAERESGAFGFADGGLRERAGAMVARINARGPYTPDQVDAMRRQIQRLLVNRLRIALDRKHNPGIAQTNIDQPIFVIGFARSGTTLLHALLAEDENALAPLAWHSRVPSPPPGLTPVSAGRIGLAQRDVEHWLDFNPALLTLHPYSDKGAYQYIEDEEVLTLDFRNAYPSLLYKVPTLGVDVVLGGDWPGAITFHKQFAQHLIWQSGKTRWVSKFSTAQQSLQTWFDAYPNALCVWSHRPMSEIYASNVTVRAATFDNITGEPMDWSGQARARAEQMKAAIDALMTNSLLNDPRIMHVPFHELTADPIALVRKIYDKRGATFTDAYEKRLRDWLNDPENKVDRYGRYPYSYEPFGLDEAWIGTLFADYSRHFGLKEKRK